MGLFHPFYLEQVCSARYADGDAGSDNDEVALPRYLGFQAQPGSLSQEVGYMRGFGYLKWVYSPG